MGGACGGDMSRGGCEPTARQVEIDTPSVSGSEAATSNERSGLGAVSIDPACWDTFSAVGRKRQQSVLSFGTVCGGGTAGAQDEQDSALTACGIGQASPIAAGNAVEGSPTSTARRIATIRFKGVSPLVRHAGRFIPERYPCVPRSNHFAPACSRYQPVRWSQSTTYQSSRGAFRGGVALRTIMQCACAWLLAVGEVAAHGNPRWLHAGHQMEARVAPA